VGAFGKRRQAGFGAANPSDESGRSVSLFPAEAESALLSDREWCNNYDLIFVTTNAALSIFEQVQYANPSWDDERVICEICTQLLDEADARPPVNVDLLASLCGIASVERGFDRPAGMLVCRDGSWVALISALDALERQRFTILHEGGHTLQPGFLRGGTFFRCPGPRNREEQLCDIAAAEMLLPRRYFAPDAAQVSELGDVEDLATGYAASMEATVRRVVDLSAQPRLMMVFQIAQKPHDLKEPQMPEPKFRLSYARSNVKLPYAVRHKSVPEESAIARALVEEVNELVCLDPYFRGPIGTVPVNARPYGDRVLALADLSGRRS
jgi:Zn-dependent peptidase ImmA (M78 family)